MKDRLSVPDVIDRFIEYRRKNPVWGSLHIALEDRNVSNADVDHCIKAAERDGDAEGAELARILRKMTRTQRCRIGALAEYQVLKVDGLP